MLHIGGTCVENKYISWRDCFTSHGMEDFFYYYYFLFLKEMLEESSRLENNIVIWSVMEAAM